MCYSAQVWQSYQTYMRVYGADVDIHQFVRFYVARRDGGRIRVAKAMDAAFASPETAE